MIRKIANNLENVNIPKKMTFEKMKYLNVADFFVFFLNVSILSIFDIFELSRKNEVFRTIRKLSKNCLKVEKLILSLYANSEF